MTKLESFGVTALGKVVVKSNNKTTISHGEQSYSHVELQTQRVEFNTLTPRWDLPTTITGATTTLVDLAYVTIIIIAYTG